MRRELRIAFILMISAAFVSGCAELNSIYRTTDLSGTTSILTDAKQRIITSTPVTKQTLQGHIDPQRVLCAEPSPDVAQAISQSLSASFEAVGKASGSLSEASSESVAQLGERLGTIQLLRDKLYRACEAYANGAISATTYTIMMSRLDKTMATLMLGEMTAGAFGRRLASLAGSAGAGARSANLDDVKNAQKNVKDAEDNVAAKQKAFDSASDAEKANAKKELEKAQEDLKQKKQVLTDLEKSYTSATASSSPGTDIGAIPGRTAAPSDAAVGNMAVLHRQFLEVDDVSTLLDACISAMDLLRNPTPGELLEVSQKVSTYQSGYGAMALAERATEATKLADDLATLRLSPFGKYCQSTALMKITAIIE